MNYYTYQDAIDHALDYIGGTPGDVASRDTRRAVLNAYRTLATEHNWSYYYKHGRVTLFPMWSQGTVQYQKTGGTVSGTSYSYLWTLTGVSTGAITNASSTTPIVITSPNHQLFSGQSVVISGVLGQTGANGTFTISYLDGDHFVLQNSTHVGDYTDNNGTQQGTWYLSGATVKTVTGATNTSPIVITTSTNHGFTTGNTVTVLGVQGQTGANGTWVVTVLSPTTLQLGGTHDSGSVYYDHSGDPLYQGHVVLQDGNSIKWPPFAGDAYIRIGQVVHLVDRVIDNTHLTTMSYMSPEVDYPAGTSYKIYQDSYVLPEDFSSTGQAYYERNFGGMEYVHPDVWLRQGRYVDQMGEPRYYTVMGCIKHPNRLEMCVFPYPFAIKTIDFIYRRMPRELKIFSYSTGVATVTSGSTTVTISVGSFSPTMVGSVLRVSSTRGSLPTSPLGTNPAAYETIISAYVDSSTVIVQDTPSATLAGMPLVVSDLVDVEPDSMLSVFERGIEMQISISRVLKDRPSATSQYEMALKKAKSADSVSFMGRVVGQQNPYRQRLARMPMTW